MHLSSDWIYNTLLYTKTGDFLAYPHKFDAYEITRCDDEPEPNNMKLFHEYTEKYYKKLQAVLSQNENFEIGPYGTKNAYQSLFYVYCFNKKIY